jgi:hypothetical protein
MEQVKNRFGSFFWIVLLCMGATLFGTGSSQAILLTNTHVYYGGPVATVSINGANQSWYTEYGLYSSEFGLLDAFCVENKPVDSSVAYELIPVPQSLLNAALIVDQFFNGSGWSKAATQIAVWEAAFDNGLNIAGGVFRYSGGMADQVAAILASLRSYTGIRGFLSLAHSPPGSVGSVASQDYLVKASVPEPATMILFGSGLIVFAISRKKVARKQPL